MWVNKRCSSCSPPGGKNYETWLLVQKYHDGNIWHVNFTKLMIFQFVIPLTKSVSATLLEFYCFTSPPVPNLDATSVVPELTRFSHQREWAFLMVLVASSGTFLCLITQSFHYTKQLRMQVAIHGKIFRKSTGSALSNSVKESYLSLVITKHSWNVNNCFISPRSTHVLAFPR